MRFERTTSRLSAGCTTSYATGPVGTTLQYQISRHLIVLEHIQSAILKTDNRSTVEWNNGSTIPTRKRGHCTCMPGGKHRFCQWLSRDAILGSDRYTQGAGGATSHCGVVHEREGRLRKRACRLLVRSTRTLHDEARRAERCGRSPDDERIHGRHRRFRHPLR